MVRKSVVITKQDKLKNSKAWAKLLKEGEEFQMRFSQYLNDLGCLYDKYGLKGVGSEEKTILSWEDRLKFSEEMDKIDGEGCDFLEDVDDYLDGTLCIPGDCDIYILEDERKESSEGNVLQFKGRVNY